MNDETMQFKFSLSTLNHLGRGLYRSFATVIAEAISNAWDADAERVDIKIEQDTLTIWDNGTGMNRDDMQSKFLKIGYTKRRSSEFSARKNRHVLGCKGIGKLSYLSISDEIIIIAKKEGEGEISIKINNNDLNNAIDEDKEDQEYNLPVADVASEDRHITRTGTQLIFKELHAHLRKKNIRQILAVHFHFAHALKADDKFEVFVDGEKIGMHDLKDLFANTQFIWFFGENSKRDFMSEMRDIWGASSNISECFEQHRVMDKCSFSHEGKNIVVRGYIASVHKPRDLRVPGSDNFKASVALFAGGRLRESELVSKASVAQIPENYLFGQIHVDDMDSGDIDRFTSARDSVKEDDILYSEFLQFLQGVQREIIDDWNNWRRKRGDEADPESAKDKIADAADALFMSWMRQEAPVARKEYGKNPLTATIRQMAARNIRSYMECFVAENLMRLYAREKNLYAHLGDEIANYKDKESKSKQKANIAFPVREGKDGLNYVGFNELARAIDIAENMQNKPDSLSQDAKTQKPVRDALMHTANLTDEARNLGSTSWTNIVHKVMKFIKK